jgi:hypothetical protein
MVYASNLRSFTGKVVMCGEGQDRPSSSMTRINDVLKVDIWTRTMAPSEVIPNSGRHFALGDTLYLWYDLRYFEEKGPPLACIFPVTLAYEIEGLDKREYQLKLVEGFWRDAAFWSVLLLALLGACFAIYKFTGRKKAKAY